MGQQASLVAALTAGPSAQSDSGSFPGGTTNIPFTLNPPQKAYNVDTGKNLANVQSPNAYAALGAIGAGGPVTQASLLYLRTVVPVLVQITVLISNAPVVIAGIPVNGLLVLEFPTNQPLTGVAVQGAAQVEYYAAGNQ